MLHRAAPRNNLIHNAHFANRPVQAKAQRFRIVPMISNLSIIVDAIGAKRMRDLRPLWASVHRD
jgi:hypothetical protein